jgi:predicted dehydrogenase
VAGSSPAKARAFAGEQAITQASASFDDLLARTDVDVVDLCVPNALHASMTIAAARAGKHVICTKPLVAYVGQDLAADASDAEVAARDPLAMLAAVRRDLEAVAIAVNESGVQLCYGENWIHAPAVMRANALLGRARASIREMRGHESHSGSHSPYARRWRQVGGGALLRLGAHPIGAMLWLKHSEGNRHDGRPIRPVAVTAEVADATRRGDSVESWGCAVITFADGSRGVALGSDCLLGGMESRLEVMASTCHFKCSLSPNDMLRAYAEGESVFGDEYLIEKGGTTAGWSTPMPDEDWTSGQQAMLEHFVTSIAAGQPVMTPGELGADVARVLYSAYASARSGRRVDL